MKLSSLVQVKVPSRSLSQTDGLSSGQTEVKSESNIQNSPIKQVNFKILYSEVQPLFIALICWVWSIVSALGGSVYRSILNPISWWSHQMETFSALLAICAGNSPVPDEFPTQRPVTRSFDVFFDLRLNKRLSKQSRGWWFETPSRFLLRHCNVLHTCRERFSDISLYCSSKQQHLFSEFWCLQGDSLVPPVAVTLRPRQNYYHLMSFGWSVSHPDEFKRIHYHNLCHPEEIVDELSQHTVVFQRNCTFVPLSGSRKYFVRWYPFRISSIGEGSEDVTQVFPIPKYILI